MPTGRGGAYGRGGTLYACRNSLPTMISTLRRWLATALSTEIGVLGARLNDLQASYDALSEDYSQHKETTTRALKRFGMRWARSNSGGVDLDVAELLRGAQR